MQARVDSDVPVQSRRRYIIGTALLFGAIVLLIGLLQTDPRAVGELGLVSALPRSALAGAAVIVIAAVASIFARPFNEPLTASCVAVLVGLISAAPAIVYDTARFSWAFKHVGIVDYITRTQGFDRGIDVLPIYHNWPGFFAGAASLTDWMGFENAIVVATWAPLALNWITLVALTYLLGQFTTSRPTVWLAALLFFVTNWIGQDYFSPQAVALILYLVIIATTLRFYQPDAPQAPTIALHVVMLLMLFALTATHQLTPLVLIVALTGLLVVRRSAIMMLPPIASVIAVAFWLSSWARTFVEDNLGDQLSGIDSPVANAAETLAKASERSDAQVLVALAGRGLILGIGLLAMIGLMQRFGRRELDGALIVLLGAPCVMMVLEFGGEILFRIALFMLPILCLLAAELLMRLRATTAMRTAAAALVAVGCFSAFSVAYFGKDSFYSFTSGELAVVTQLMDEAPEGALLVEGSRNYPSQFLEYEKFTYVAIERESEATQARIANAPADEMYRWLSNDEYTARYLVLTRSQQKEAEAVGSFPSDYLPAIEAALRSDDRFTVLIEDPDAVVFTVLDP